MPLAVTNRNDEVNTVSPPMTAALIASFVFHLAVVIILSIGVPFDTKPTPLLSKPITVEFVEVAEKTQAPEKPKSKKPEPVKSEKLPEPEPEPPKEQPEAPPKMTEKTPPKPPRPDPVKMAEVEKPREKPVIDPAPPRPERDDEDNNQDDFQTLLRNLAPDAPEERSSIDDVLDEVISEDNSGADQIAQKLTASELNVFYKNLERCWNIPAGARFAEQLDVIVRVTVNPDRTVQSALVIDSSLYNSDSFFQAAADAAMRALKHPDCSPLALPEGKYEQWKTFVIRFDPQDML